MGNELRGSAAVIAAMMVFGSMGLFVRLVPTSTITLLFFMQVFASVILFLVLLRKGIARIKTPLRYLLALAVVAVANDLFYFNAFRLTTISNAILTHYTAPIFVAFMAPFLIKEKLEKSSLAALVLSFSGLFIIFYSGISLSTNLDGILFGVGSGVFYALVIIIYKYILRETGLLHMMFCRYALSALLLLPLVVVEAPVLSIPTLALLFTFAVIFSVMASMVHAFGIKHVKAQHAGVLGYIEPVAGTAYAFVFLSEAPTLFTLMGGVLIVLGGYITIRSQR